jgi:Fur family zinc uptake transcriptional regulator
MCTAAYSASLLRIAVASYCVTAILDPSATFTKFQKREDGGVRQLEPMETAPGAGPDPWDGVAGRLRASGLRWTPQRRTLVEVLRKQRGHVTATDLIARCRELDRTTTPSTVYRTLDVLGHFGLVSQARAPDGREEYHVLPEQVHGHVFCSSCGTTWELRPETGAAIVDALAADLGFTVDLSQVTISGRCSVCNDQRVNALEGSEATLRRSRRV